jgi:GlpG protein
VVRFPLQKDLLPLLNFLQSQQVLYRVTEEEGNQQLWILDEPRVLEVAEYCSKWASGELILETTENNDEDILKPSVSKMLVFMHLVRLLPVSMLMILLGLLGTLAYYGDTVTLHYAQPLLFQAFYMGQFTPVEITLNEGQYWRLFSPMFLHFGYLHFLFNALFLWVIGRRIELAKGSLHYLVVILISALVANVAQYLQQPNTAFGGLSGVVYAVIGYVGIYQRFIQHPVLQFNEAAIIFFIVWLMLGVLGVVDWFMSGSIANAAHVAGLACGGVLGGLMVIVDKGQKKNQ